MNEVLTNVQTEYYRYFRISYTTFVNQYTNSRRVEIAIDPTEYTDAVIYNMFLKRCMTRVNGKYFKSVKQAREFIDGCYNATVGNTSRGRSFSRKYV